MPRRNKEREEREKADKAKEKEMDLRDKAQACIVFRERGHLLDKSSSTELQHIVRFLCRVKKNGEGRHIFKSRWEQEEAKREDGGGPARLDEVF